MYIVSIQKIWSALSARHRHLKFLALSVDQLPLFPNDTVDNYSSNSRVESIYRGNSVEEWAEMVCPSTYVRAQHSNFIQSKAATNNPSTSMLMAAKP